MASRREEVERGLPCLEEPSSTGKRTAVMYVVGKGGTIFIHSSK